MGGLNIARGIVGGIAGAAGDAQTKQEMDAANQQENQRQQNLQKAKLAPFALNVKSLQQRLSTAQPNTPEYNQIADEIQHNVHSMREVLHPDWKPGPTEWLKAHTTDRLHITNADQRQRELIAKQQKTVGEENKVAGALVDSAPQSPFTAWSAQYQQATGHPPTSAEAQQFAEKQGGILSTQKPNLKNFKGPNGEIAALDANKPEAIPDGWTLAGTGQETTDTRARGDFSAFQKDHPEYKGSFEQWKTEQAAVGRASQNRDDRYIAGQQKKASGQPLTADEQAYQTAYETFIKKTKTDPGVARAAAFSANRYVPVVDPNDPEKVTLMRAGDAAKAGVGTPQSIAFQTDKALTRAFTSGNEAKTVTAFNTASDHLKMLGDAAKALGNGDLPLFNKLSVAYQKATGNPAPTNFEAIRAAASGEIAKTFGELNIPGVEAVTAPLATSGSPAQLAGTIGADYDLMQSKLHGLQGQYEAGKQGKPNFPTSQKMKQLQDSRGGGSNVIVVTPEDMK